jgi:ADP-heptose:LPS heptosyltransferase
MSSRLSTRIDIAARALLHWRDRTPSRPAAPQRILIAHQLLLGDTLMTTPLIAKLREQYPDAEIVMAMPSAAVPLYQGRPYGVSALPFSPKRRETIAPIAAAGPFDLAFLPGDNRFSWLARAVSARWIVAWNADTPAYKNWPVDERVAWPATPGALGDLWAAMQPGASPAPFDPSKWPAPAHKPFDLLKGRFAVFHVGASNEKKLWPATHWQTLAREVGQLGVQVVWSAGPGEEHLVAACDPGGKHLSYAGRLDLAQLWRLLKEAVLLVAPDTGVAHLAKVTGTPAITLFGAGPTFLYGRGSFWSAMPFHPCVLADLPPRRQVTLFRRAFPWLSGPHDNLPGVRYAPAGTAPSEIGELARNLLQNP